jgi:hypothetical protein
MEHGYLLGYRIVLLFIKIVKTCTVWLNFYFLINHTLIWYIGGGGLLYYHKMSQSFKKIHLRFIYVLLVTFRFERDFPPRHNWNIVGSGAKHHNPNPERDCSYGPLGESHLYFNTKAFIDPNMVINLSIDHYLNNSTCFPDIQGDLVVEFIQNQWRVVSFESDNLNRTPLCVTMDNSEVLQWTGPNDTPQTDFG